MLKSPSSTWSVEASETAAETKEKNSWVSGERGSSSGWFAEEVEEKFHVLYTLWIITSLTPSTGLLRDR
jgi:hypothetical protein